LDNLVERDGIYYKKITDVRFSEKATQNYMKGNYMMGKHGISDPFYCDLDDPIEEIACMAWDSAVGKDRAQVNPTDLKINLVMNAAILIQNIASASRNGLYVSYLRAIAPFNSEKSELCIIQKHGVCGNHQHLLQRVLEYVGIPSRYIGIYFVDSKFGRSNHAANEVLIDGKWRFIDTTWASMWFLDKNSLSSAVSFQELIESKQQFTRITNEMDIWFRFQYERNIDPFSYLNQENHLAIVKNEEGVLNLNLNDKLGFQHVPNYIGTNSGKNSGISMKWDTPQFNGNINLSLVVSSVGGCLSQGATLLDDTGNEYPLTQGENQITIPNGATFNVKREPDEICYIVLSDISLNGKQEFIRERKEN